MKNWMVVGALAAGVATSTLSASARAAADQTQPGSDVEEVFSYLAVRSNRTPGASDPACNDAGFAVRNRNDSDLRALMVTRDGRVESTAQTIGSAVSCFSTRSEAGVIQFFARLTIRGTSAVGRGECVQRYTDYPEPRVGVQECWLKLEQLPDGYVGGFVTVNAVATRIKDATAASACADGPCGRGVESDPPGYVLPSITTVRLWKKRR
jgi:hypothetical protein